MNYSNLEKLVLSFKKGTIHTLQYERPLKTKKNITDDIRKIETVQVSFGINYDNKQSVVESRTDGTLPTTNQGLQKNLKWIIYPYILQNTQTGKFLLRCNGLKTSKHEIDYYKNGQKVDAAVIIGDCYANEVHTSIPDPRPTFNLDIDKVIDLT